MGILVGLFISFCLVFLSSKRVIAQSYEVDEFFETSKSAVVSPDDEHMVNLTLILSSPVRKAVCLDGSSPGYYLERGYGSGANSWLIQFEGEGWCNTIRNCKYRTKSPHGSSKFFEKTSISVKVAYCDGGLFAGNSENKRATRMASCDDRADVKGNAQCKPTSILHCNNFRKLFPETTKVKCLSDAGLFINAADVSGRHTIRKLYIDVVRLHGVRKRLTGNCPEHIDGASCFFPSELDYQHQNAVIYFKCRLRFLADPRELGS